MNGFRLVRWFSLFCGFLALMGSASAAASTADTQDLQPASTRHAGVLIPIAALPLETAPPVDLQQVSQEDLQREEQGLPLRFAIPNDVTLSPDDDGIWEAFGADTLVWRTRVGSPGALSLNLGFIEFEMPEGGRLMIYASDLSRVVRPFTAKDNQDHGQLWTPIVQADELVIEVTIPREKEDELRLKLGHINVGYRPFGSNEPLSGSCNNDVVCPEGVPWQDEIEAAALYQVGGFLTCSGSMINNTSNDQTPLFLTAYHCGVSAGNAASVVVYFNFETSTCGGTPDGNLSQFVSGSTFRARYSPSDFALVELNSDPNPDWGVTFAGWDRSGANATSAVAIHHPNLDEKRISFEDDPTSTTSYLSNSVPGNGTHIRVTDWDDGTTEGGSSGSPLYDQNHRIIGQLHGGYASCSSQTSDWYGKLSVSWTGGGSPSSRLSDWLDPGNTGAMTTDTLAEDVPSLSSPTQIIDDSTGGNGNGVAEPGETVTLIVHAANGGELAATNVNGTLSSNTPKVTVPGNTASWPTLLPNKTALSLAPHFTVTLSATLLCGTPVNLGLDLTANEDPGLWSSSFSFVAGSPTVGGLFSDDMESGVGGWSAANLVGTNTWSQVTSNSNSPTHSWFVADVGSRTDSTLVAPTFNNLPANAVLRFQHFLNSEVGAEAFDGGVLEFSINGGSNWFDAGGLVTQGVYNSVISSSYNSPLSGRPAWAGNFGGWREVEVNLSSLAGDNVLLRWRFATDSSVSAEGWYIDDVEIETVTYSCQAPLAPPGEASEPGTGSDFFFVEVDPGGYALSWGAPVGGGPVDDYVLYRIPIGSPTADPACENTTLGSGTSFVESNLADNSYFLVVARNAAGEGPYGENSAGAPRPTANGGICP